MKGENMTKLKSSEPARASAGRAPTGRLFVLDVFDKGEQAPVPLLAGYSASKAALQSLTQALRGTLAKSGITVIGIYPGPIDTDLAKGIPLEKSTPEHAAINIVRGIEKGDSYIFPDPMALQIEHLWAHESRQLETAMLLGG